MISGDQINYYSQHTAKDPTRRSYVVGETAARQVVRAAREADAIAVDIETAGLGEKAFQVKCLIIATPRRAYVLDAANEVHCRAFRDALRDAKKLIFHNSAYDVPPLYCAGLMSLDDIAKVFDTLVCARMALTGFGARRGLDNLEKRYLSGVLRGQSKDGFGEWAKVNGLSKGKAFEVATYDHPVYQMYAGWDAILTAMIEPFVYDDAIAQLTNHPFGRYGADAETARCLIEREQRVNRVMLRRSARGLAVDPDRLESEQDRLRSSMNALADALAEAGIKDPSNRNQLAAVLDDLGAFPEDYPRTKTLKISTAKENLETVDHELARTFREHDQHRRLFTYMEHARLVAKYTDGRVHPQVNVLHARTGRMSYSNPELHQFVADARTIFVRDDEHSGLVSIDWASIEPVTIANLAGDIGPIERFEQSGEKFYKVIQDAAGVDYKTSKVVLLAALYGQQIRSLSGRLGTTLDEAKVLQAKVFGPLPMTRRFCGWSAAWSEEVGKTWTVSGRIVDVDRDAGYKGTNYSVQGSAYDILAETIVGIDDEGLADHLYLTMHDECVISEEAAPDVRRIMETPPPRLIELAERDVKLRTDAAFLGDRWDDADRHPSWPVDTQAAA